MFLGKKETQWPEEAEEEQDEAAPAPTKTEELPILHEADVQARVQALVEDFKRDSIVGESLFELRERCNKYHEDLMEIVNLAWAQINETKVIYAEMRTSTFLLSPRKGLDIEDRTIIQHRWVTRERQHFILAVRHHTAPVPSPGKVSPKKRKRGEEEAVYLPVTWKKKPLVELWLNWDARRIFDTIVHEPNPESVTNKTFNVWTPYAIDEARALEFVQKKGWSDEECMRRVRPWIQHIFHVIADGNVDYFKYIINWFTWPLVMKTKSGAAMMLASAQGAGKTTLTEMYCEIFGPHNSCIVTRGDELTGQFNQHLGFKVFVVSEEATYGGSKKDEGSIKNLITSNVFNMRSMYHPVISMTSRHNVLMIGQRGKHLLRIDPEERRFACFFPSDVYSGIQTKKSAAYFSTLREVPPQLVAWFHYFKVDLTDWSARLNIPVTQATEDQKMRSIPLQTRYLLELLQTSTTDMWTSTYAEEEVETMFDRYVDWIKKKNFNSRYQGNMHEFAIAARKHLLPRARATITENGVKKKTSRRKWNPYLGMQRLHFARSMELKKFPTLDGEEENDEEAKGDAPANITDALEQGEGLSPRDRSQLIQRSASRWRLEAKNSMDGCPPSCKGKHSPFVRMEGEELVECSEHVPGAKPYHHFDLPEMAPMFRQQL